MKISDIDMFRILDGNVYEELQTHVGELILSYKGDELQEKVQKLYESYCEDEIVKHINAVRRMYHGCTEELCRSCEQYIFAVRNSDTDMGSLAIQAFDLKRLVVAFQKVGPLYKTMWAPVEGYDLPQSAPSRHLKKCHYPTCHMMISHQNKYCSAHWLQVFQMEMALPGSSTDSPHTRIRMMPLVSRVDAAPARSMGKRVVAPARSSDDEVRQVYQPPAQDDPQTFFDPVSNRRVGSQPHGNCAKCGKQYYNDYALYRGQYYHVYCGMQERYGPNAHYVATSQMRPYEPRPLRALSPKSITPPLTPTSQGNIEISDDEETGLPDPSVEECPPFSADPEPPMVAQLLRTDDEIFLPPRSGLNLRNICERRLRTRRRL